MKTVRVTKQFTFEMASALPNYDGDCANIHGHSYTMDVTLKGKPIEDVANPLVTCGKCWRSIKL